MGGADNQNLLTNWPVDIILHRTNNGEEAADARANNFSFTGTDPFIS